MKGQGLKAYAKYVQIYNALGQKAAEQWISKQPKPWREEPGDRIHVCTDAEKYDYFNRLAEGDEE